MFQTEFDFTLPCGYLDEEVEIAVRIGNCHVPLPIP